MRQVSVKVHISRAHKASLLGINRLTKKLYYFNPVVHSEGQYLYFTADDIIKPGDLVLRDDESVFMCGSVCTDHFIERPTIEGAEGVHRSHCRKLVATSNPDLWNLIPIVGKIPLSFIKEYAKEQGIKEVKIDYYSNPYEDLCDLCFGIRLDSDGCVVIYKPKKSTKKIIGKVLDKIFTIR